MKKKLREEDRYAVTVEWSEENSGFVARVPAMPGCICVMDTEVAALKEIRILIREFLDIRQERELRKLQLVAA
jgi:predicted RNase H-like HicB family nuclease